MALKVAKFLTVSPAKTTLATWSKTAWSPSTRPRLRTATWTFSLEASFTRPAKSLTRAKKLNKHGWKKCNVHYIRY